MDRDTVEVHKLATSGSSEGLKFTVEIFSRLFAYDSFSFVCLFVCLFLLNGIQFLRKEGRRASLTTLFLSFIKLYYLNSKTIEYWRVGA